MLAIKALDLFLLQINAAQFRKMPSHLIHGHEVNFVIDRVFLIVSPMKIHEVSVLAF